MNWQEYFKNESLQIEEELIEVRRHLHKNPELSFKEFKTADFLENKLKEYGITDYKRVCKTGIVGFIGEGKDLIVLRGDLDALPIVEANNCEYKSQNEGVMHACGHDVHTTCLLGALKLLKSKENELPNKVMFIFQPGEEKLPGGASLLIKEGIFDGLQPKVVVGQHVYPEMEVGKVGYREGIYMASCDELFINVHGKGGHGAMPHKNIDPIVIGSQIVVALQQLVSRVNDPKIPTVVSIGEFIAKGATNICPEKATMQGTIRTFNEKWRAELHEKIIKLCEGIGESFGAKVEVIIDKGYPYLENHPESTRQWSDIAKKVMGEENVEELDIRMTAEDFSYYSQVQPSVFYRLGVGNVEKGITSSVHSPTFDIDERALRIGAELFANAAVEM